MRVLVIEDDHRLARLIRQVLEEQRWVVDVAHDGWVGREMLLNGQYDVAIIDWMLPEQDGPTICRIARSARITTSLLMLTARAQVEDRVLGLDSGADDYLPKPFAFEELLARVRALARRHLPEPGGVGEEIRCGAMVLDLHSHTARYGNQPLELTATEWNLLEFLMRHAGQALSRQQILDYVWSYEREVQPSMVDVYISYLRRKLEQPGIPNPIVTVRGVGYRLENR